jgi:hypothetical protein
MNGNNTNGTHNFRVFLRALEGLPLLVFAVACLAFSLYVRKDPLF